VRGNQARPRSRRRVAPWLAAALAGFAAVCSAPAAAASPTETLQAKIAQAQRIEAAIEAANTRADQLDEQYLEAHNLLVNAQHDITTATRALQAGEQHAAELRASLQGRAAELYMSADSSAGFVALQARDVTDVGWMTKYSDAAAQHDVATLDDVRRSDIELTSLRTDLQHTQTEAQSRRRRLDKAMRSLERATKHQQALLASTANDIMGLVDEIALQRAAALELAAHKKLASQLPGVPAPPDLGVDVGGGTGTDPGMYPGPTPGADAAVAFARKQIGDPYVYAGAGPNIWDCSGLTMVAWSHGHVAMDHSAQDQYAMFGKVALTDLQPGDLVFFGKPIHHVAIYIGAGTMIEAPHTGAFVRFASIFRDDLVLNGVRPTIPAPPLPPGAPPPTPAPLAGAPPPGH